MALTEDVDAKPAPYRLCNDETLIGMLRGIAGALAGRGYVIQMDPVTDQVRVLRRVG